MRTELLPYVGRRVRYAGTVDNMNFYTRHAMVNMLDVCTPDGVIVNHLWLRMKITDSDKLLQGNYITFTAVAYKYRRDDGTENISLMLPQSITVSEKKFLVEGETCQ